MSRVIAVVLGCLLLGGCSAVPWPFTAGSSEFLVTVEMANAVNLVPYAEVKVAEVTVGSVRSIEAVDRHAQLVVALEEQVELPANAVARIGQKSLLGAEYLELAAPDRDPAGRLADGDLIPLERSGRYPETEEVLAAASLFLNGGGLAQLRTVTTELNAALGGREDSTRALLTDLGTFVGALDDQRADLIRALEGLDRLSGTVAQQSDVVETALDTIPPGLAALDEERETLLRALESIGAFGDAATEVLDASEEDLLANVRDLQPVLRELADAGRDLPESLDALTLPFPGGALRRAASGDYVNLFATVDLTPATVGRAFLSGTPLEGVLAGGPLGEPPTGPGVQAVDPLLAPLPLPAPLPVPLPAPLPVPVPSPSEPSAGPDSAPAAPTPSRDAPAGRDGGGPLDRLFGGN